jgi:glycosyltransferase involved in cell wall biosynthesis
LRRWLVSHLYRFAFRQRQLVVIFQNPDDRDTLLCLGVVRSQQTRIIRGSGVSLDEYPYVPEPQSRPVVVMASRLLKDKGVCEFVEAARLLQSRNVDVLMRLIGSPDPGNLSSITTEEMNDWKHEGIVDLMGYRTDIAEQYAASNIVCLPSYREGLPKSLIEAAACGRAVVTTDVPGCRDAIEPGITGLLVPPRDPGALADAIEHLIENPSELKNMGRAGRRLAEREFGIDKIVNQHLEIYRELLSND